MLKCLSNGLIGHNKVSISIPLYLTREMKFRTLPLNIKTSRFTGKRHKRTRFLHVSNAVEGGVNFLFLYPKTRRPMANNVH